MINVINVLFFLSIMGTVISLLVGILNFFRPMPNGVLANASMRWRVLFQFLALLFFSLIMWLR
jgi:hypothetical protein